MTACFLFMVILRRAAVPLSCRQFAILKADYARAEVLIKCKIENCGRADSVQNANHCRPTVFVYIEVAFKCRGGYYPPTRRAAVPNSCRQFVFHYTNCLHERKKHERKNTREKNGCVAQCTQPFFENKMKERLTFYST